MPAGGDFYRQVPQRPDAEHTTVRLPRPETGYAPAELPRWTVSDVLRRHGRIIVLAFSFGSVFVLVEATSMVLAFQDGEYLAGLMLLFLGVCGVGVVAAWLSRNKVTPRATVDAGGLTVRPDRRLDAWLLVVLLTGSLGFGLFGYLQLATDPEPAMDNLATHMIMFNVVSPVLGVAVLVFPTAFLLAYLLGALAQGGTSRVRLTPYGFAFSNGIGSSSGTWEQIADITDAVPHRPRLLWHPVGVLLADGTYRRLAAPGKYTPGGWALRDMMRFYWLYPQHRSELTDDRAPQRLLAAAAAPPPR